MTRRLAALLLALVATVAATSARADDVAQAKARFRGGVELYEARRWREAIAEFEAAYRLKPHGAIHYNVAQCRERLGEWPAAIRSYLDYLREVPDAKDRPAVRAAIHRLEERLAATGAQPLVVYSDPPGAEVRIDGKRRGVTPMHTVLPPGSYAVGLALDGHEPASEEATIGSAAAAVVDVELRRTRAPSRPLAEAPASGDAASPPPGDPGGAGGPSPGGSADLRPRPPSSAPAPGPSAPSPAVREHRRVWTWVSVAVSAAAVAAGAYEGLAARRLEREYADGTIRTAAENTALTNDATRTARRANVLYGAAAVAGAAGATLFFVEGRF